MSEFLSRVVMRDPESEILVTVIQALELQLLGQTNVTLLFDIDPYEDVSLPADDVTMRATYGTEVFYDEIPEGVLSYITRVVS